MASRAKRGERSALRDGGPIRERSGGGTIVKTKELNKKQRLTDRGGRYYH